MWQSIIDDPMTLIVMERILTLELPSGSPGPKMIFKVVFMRDGCEESFQTCLLFMNFHAESISEIRLFLSQFVRKL